MSEKRIVSKPGFYDDFHCIGSRCRNHCCHDWNVKITKQEFKNIKRHIQSEELKNIFAHGFSAQHHTSMQKTRTYQIKQDEYGNCLFLDEKGLCRIHKECGEALLAQVCKNFPKRATLYYMQKANYALSLGCEEVVRLLFLQKDGFFIKACQQQADKKMVCDIFDDNKAKQFPSVVYFYDMKMLFLGILQNRQYTLSERMVLLAMALQKIEKEQHLENIPAFVNHFLNNMNQAEYQKMYRDFFKKVKKDSKVNIQHMMAYLDILSNHKGTWGQIWEEIMPQKSNHNKTQHDKNKAMDIDKAAYENAKKEFEQYLQKNPHFLENIMVSVAWYNEYPYISGFSLWESYCLFAVVYSIYHFVLTLYCQKQKTQEQIIDCIVVLSRILTHSRQVWEKMYEIFKQNNTLAHMAVWLLWF